MNNDLKLNSDIDNLDYNDCVYFTDWDNERSCEVVKIGCVVDLRHEKDGVWLEYNNDWYFIERSRITGVIKEENVIKEYDWLNENANTYQIIVGDYERTRNEMEECIRVIEESKRKK